MPTNKIQHPTSSPINGRPETWSTTVPRDAALSPIQATPGLLDKTEPNNTLSMKPLEPTNPSTMQNPSTSANPNRLTAASRTTSLARPTHRKNSRTHEVKAEPLPGNDPSLKTSDKLRRSSDTVSVAAESMEPPKERRLGVIRRALSFDRLRKSVGKAVERKSDPQRETRGPKDDAAEASSSHTSLTDKAAMVARRVSRAASFGRAPKK